jgi:hypothetical protein
VGPRAGMDVALCPATNRTPVFQLVASHTELRRRMAGWSINNEFEGTWKEAVGALIKGAITDLEGQRKDWYVGRKNLMSVRKSLLCTELNRNTLLWKT